MKKVITLVLVILALVAIFYILMTDGISETIKTREITNLVENYFETHTYSKADLFSCTEMSTDLWNQFKTVGFDAKIAIGNLQKQNATPTEMNHAWLLVEISPFKWIAVETTLGKIVQGNENPVYFKNAVSFDSPAELQKYMELRTLYFDEWNKLEVFQTSSCNEYKANIVKYNALVEKYNKDFANSKITEASLSNSTQIKKIKEDTILMQGRCEKENEVYAAELNKLNDLNEKMALLLT